MSDEYSEYPNLSDLMAQRMAQRASSMNITTATTPPGTVDPYQVMLKKKQAEVAPDIDPATVTKWPDESMKKLQDYCNKMGITGVNPGKLHPSIVLAQLKKQYGEDYTDVPLDERVPEGYEKLGTKNVYGPNYPYSEAMTKKQILHG